MVFMVATVGLKGCVGAVVAEERDIHFYGGVGVFEELEAVLGDVGVFRSFVEELVYHF